MPNNRRQRRTCYALCHILYPVSAAHTSVFRMDSNSTSYEGKDAISAPCSLLSGGVGQKRAKCVLGPFLRSSTKHFAKRGPNSHRETVTQQPEKNGKSHRRDSHLVRASRFTSRAHQSVHFRGIFGQDFCPIGEHNLVWGLMFGVESLRFGVWRLGVGVEDSRFWV